MKCKKCGAELLTDDLFCGECGTKVEEETVTPKPNEAVNEQINFNQTEEKREANELNNNKKNPKDKKKVGIIIGIIIAVVIIAVLTIPKIGPEEIEMEAKDLAAIMYSNEVEQYAGDTLIVHGLLYKDTRNGIESEDGYYAVCEDPSDENNESMVMFKYDEGIADDVGTGSEVIVIGTLDEDGMSLIATNIEVVKKVEPLYKFNDIDDLISKSNEYVNRNIIVKGLLDNTDKNNICLKNNAETKSIKLFLTESDRSAVEYGIYTIKGTFYYKDGEPTIDVEKANLVEKKENIASFDSLEQLLHSAEEYRGKIVHLEGWLEVEDDSIYILEGDYSMEIVGLGSNQEMTYHGTVQPITGILEGGQHDPYYLNVMDIGY